MERHLEVISRALIVSGNKILLCGVSGEKWHFLPGGHVEFGEESATGLAREIHEEMGVSDAKIGDLLSTIENQYEDELGKHHEFNLLYKVELKGLENIKSQENHIEFTLKDIVDLKDVKILPPNLKAEVLKHLGM